MDYLVVQEAEDGTWFDEGETAVGLQRARTIGRGMSPRRGYEVTIYSLQYVETVNDPTKPYICPAPEPLDATNE